MPLFFCTCAPNGPSKKKPQQADNPYEAAITNLQEEMHSHITLIGNTHIKALKLWALIITHSNAMTNPGSFNAIATELAQYISETANTILSIGKKEAYNHQSDETVVIEYGFSLVEEYYKIHVRVMNEDLENPREWSIYEDDELKLREQPSTTLFDNASLMEKLQQFALESATNEPQPDSSIAKNTDHNIKHMTIVLNSPWFAKQKRKFEQTRDRKLVTFGTTLWTRQQIDMRQSQSNDNLNTAKEYLASEVEKAVKSGYFSYRTKELLDNAPDMTLNTMT